MNEVSDISSVIYIKNDLSNRFKTSFRLFREEHEDLGSTILIYQKNNRDIDSSMSVRVTRENVLSSQINIVYKNRADLPSIISAISVSQIDAMINVRPHNRFISRFNLMAAPIVTKTITSIADATTRSREDLRTMNYGDTNSMAIGRSVDEEFYSFIRFGDLDKEIADLKIIKSAKLRIYYSAFSNGKNIVLSQPNSVWREMGVTDANRPHAVEVLKENGYEINTKNRYIEFDFTDVTKRWFNKELPNYGFILSTDDNDKYYFLARESGKAPELIISYITNQIYSIGRSQIDSTIFINSLGWKDINGAINVPSTSDKRDLDSTIYVHRYADPMPKDKSAEIKISTPDLSSEIFINIGGEKDFDGSLEVIVKSARDLFSNVIINTPELASRITVDNNAHLRSFIVIRQKDKAIFYSDINVSVPDLASELTVSDYTSGRSDLYATFTYRAEKELLMDSVININAPDLPSEIRVRAKGWADNDAVIQAREINELPTSLIINNPDLIGEIDVKAVGWKDLSSVIQAREMKVLPASLSISNPDLSSQITVRYHEDLSAQIFVRESKYLDSTINIMIAADVDSTINTVIPSDMHSIFNVSVPDLPSEIKVRVTRHSILSSEIFIRQRGVNDLNSFIRVGGTSNRNLIIIF